MPFRIHTLLMFCALAWFTPCVQARMVQSTNYSLPEKPDEIRATQISPDQVGRWLSEDPIGEAGGLNLYGYVGNGPVGAVDPEGKIGWIAVGALAVAAGIGLYYLKKASDRAFREGERRRNELNKEDPTDLKPMQVDMNEYGKMAQDIGKACEHMPGLSTGRPPVLPMPSPMLTPIYQKSAVLPAKPSGWWGTFMFWYNQFSPQVGSGS